MNGLRWERIGAVSGILFVVTIVATFFVPSTPDVDDPAAEIRESLIDDRNGLIAGVYLSGLGAFFFLAFPRDSLTSAPYEPALILRSSCSRIVSRLLLRSS